MTQARAPMAVEGVIRHYEWGSPDTIPALLGVEADARPAAELWFGAHPDGPSPVPELGTTLDRLIAADPAAALGGGVVRRCGPQLPFLLKVLAAGKPLSIQVHPTRGQAEAGFEREDAESIARDAPQRTYRDRNHKPELLCALTPFEALCGFRPVADTQRLLGVLGLPALARARELLAGGGGLRAAFTHLLTLPEPAALVAAVAERAAAITEGEWAGAAGGVLRAAREFPGDAGVLVALLLNFVQLAPGEAIYLGAGTVHSYLHGTGVEVMANSDNVLRCGLTTKHVDVGGLLRITEFAPVADPRLPGSGAAAGALFSVPVPDFELFRADLGQAGGAGEYAFGGDERPFLVLCVTGTVRLESDTTAVVLRPGHAAFVPAAAAGCVLRGAGRAFVASTGG